jgi:hypothetical protein
MNAWTVVVVSHTLIEMLKLIDHTKFYSICTYIHGQSREHCWHKTSSSFSDFYFSILYIYIHIYSWFLSPCVYIYTSMCTNNFFFSEHVRRRRKKARECEHRLISFSHKEYKKKRKRKERCLLEWNVSVKVAYLKR